MLARGSQLHRLLVAAWIPQSPERIKRKLPCSACGTDTFCTHRIDTSRATQAEMRY
jgi:hypothetical protein